MNDRIVFLTTKISLLEAELAAELAKSRPGLSSWRPRNFGATLSAGLTSAGYAWGRFPHFEVSWFKDQNGHALRFGEVYAG